MSDAEPAVDPRAPWERCVELAVYVPVGLAVSIKDDLPRIIRQGRQAVENRVQLARWIGQMAVQQGQRELAKRIEERREAASPATEPTTEPAVAVTEPAVAVGEPAAGPAAVVTEPLDDAAPAPSAASLPIEGYESLAALHVVQRLAGLSAAELEDVRRFEAAHRARRTILAKVAQLQGD